MSRIVDQIVSELRARADQNGDQKLDMKDVAVVAQAVKTKVAAETTKYPLSALAAAVIVASVVSVAITRALC